MTEGKDNWLTKARWLSLRFQTIHTSITENVNQLLTNGWKKPRMNGLTEKRAWSLRFWQNIMTAQG